MQNKHNSESIVFDIKRNTRKKYNTEEKMTIVLEGLRGDDSIAAICRDILGFVKPGYLFQQFPVGYIPHGCLLF